MEKHVSYTNVPHSIRNHISHLLPRWNIKKKGIFFFLPLSYTLDSEIYDWKSVRGIFAPSLWDC